MEKKYLVCIKKYLVITDSEDIINHANQGWQFDGMCNYHTSMVAVSKTFEVEIVYSMVKNYLDAMSMIPNIEVQWMETEDGASCWNRNPDTGEWEDVKAK